MRTEDYPALYQAMDTASVEAQSMYLACVRGYSILLIAGATFTLYGTGTRWAAIVAACLFVGALFISVLIAVRGHEDTWYRARAVAESVKTATWRFMMRAEPYEDAQDLRVVTAAYRNLLHNVLNEHKKLAAEFGRDESMSEQVTRAMLDMRSLSLEERVEKYRRKRIDEQRAWYARKASFNRRRGRTWLGILIALQAFAVISMIARAAFPEWQAWPTDVVVVAASGALTWIQVKRFRELSAAYGLTAQEIGVIRSELEDVQTESDFAQFVADAENAFSREHTQWIARKD